MEIFLGIDVGGSGVKGAIVNSTNGELMSERFRLDTPKYSTPENVAKTVRRVVKHFNYEGMIGCSFPTVVMHGRAKTHGNIHKSWLNVQVDELFEHVTGHPFVVHNDADLAGLAEMELGVGRGKMGKVIMITIGTGLGSGVFYDGVLIPNLELGRIFGKDGKPIEYYAGDRARKIKNLSWEKWGERFDFYLHHIVRVCSPDYFIFGGGASKKLDKFEDQITIDVPYEVAHFRNNAGIIGAAMAAKKAHFQENKFVLQ